MAMDPTFATLLGIAVNVAIGTFFTNSRLDAVGRQLSRINDRLGAVELNLTSLIQAETAKLQARLARDTR